MNAATTTTFWLPLQRQATATSTTIRRPTALGYKNGNAARGANCVTPRAATRRPTTFGDWCAGRLDVYNGRRLRRLHADLRPRVRRQRRRSTATRPPRSARRARSRTTSTRGVVSRGRPGRAAAASDYDALPADILDEARAGVAAIGWNKGGAGPSVLDQPPAPPPTATPTPSAAGRRQHRPAAPAAGRATRSRSLGARSGTPIRLSLQLPGAGTLRDRVSAKPKKGKAIKLARQDRRRHQGGHADESRSSLYAKAKSALKRKDKRLKVTLKITYTPDGRHREDGHQERDGQAAGSQSTTTSRAPGMKPATRSALDEADDSPAPCRRAVPAARGERAREGLVASGRRCKDRLSPFLIVASVGADDPVLLAARATSKPSSPGSEIAAHAR